LPFLSHPVLQVALDVTDLDLALKLAKECWDGGARWIEAGTPLIKSVGMKAIRELRRILPEATIVADMKCMDAGFLETEMASLSGANVVTVLGVASDATIKEVIKAAKKYDVKVMVDLINTSNPVKRGLDVEVMGADIVCLHTGIDVQSYLKTTAYENLFEYIRKACEVLHVPVAVAGGITVEKVLPLIDSGVKVIIVGSAITKSKNPKEAVKRFIEKFPPLSSGFP